MNQSECEAITCSWRKARENACACTSRHWYWFAFLLVKKKGGEVADQVTEGDNAKPKQTQFTFDAQLKTRSYKGI